MRFADEIQAGSDPAILGNHFSNVKNSRSEILSGSSSDKSTHFRHFGAVESPMH